jgi:EcsC protein family
MLSASPEAADTLPPEARTALDEALRRLGRGGGGVVRIARAVARLGAARLPRMLASGGAATLETVARTSLERAFTVAVRGLPDTFTADQVSVLPGGRLGSAGAAHLATAISGAVGGAAGIWGTLPDAAFTTLLIMRQIAAIALREGEDLSHDDSRLACLEVFALDPGGEGGYWTARLLLRGAPLAAILTQAGRLWGIALGEKFVAGAAPMVGAAGGVLVNTAFLSHYRALADGHFTIRRLERQYGADAVRMAAATLGG